MQMGGETRPQKPEATGKKGIFFVLPSLIRLSGCSHRYAAFFSKQTFLLVIQAERVFSLISIIRIIGRFLRHKPSFGGFSSGTGVIVGESPVGPAGLQTTAGGETQELKLKNQEKT